ncbi:MAG: glycosyltransferase family 4 protein [Veillonellales bacterium]
MKEKRLVFFSINSFRDFTNVGRDDLVEYFNPGGFFAEVYFLSPYDELGAVQVANGFTVIGLRPEQYRETIRQIAPDVIRTYGGAGAATFALANRIPGVPIAVGVHDTYAPFIHPSLVFADMVICVSRVVAEAVVKIAHVDPARIRILPDYINIHKFSLVDHPVIKPDFMRQIEAKIPQGKCILHIGRKVESKNWDTLVSAVKLLPEEYYCLLIGRGDEQPIYQLAESLGIRDRVFCLPVIKNSDLINWYANCACFCLPSRWEGLGMVFIEAAASGCCIVTADIPPMNEYFTHDKNAYLVKNGENPYELAAGIAKVCSDAVYRRTLGANARLAAKEFAPEKINRQASTIYNELLLKFT